MARKKYEFRPDPAGYDLAGKLYLTRLQRQKLLKWLLYGLVCLLGLVLQDSLLAGLKIFGGGFEIAPALVILICVVEGCEAGSGYAFACALIYAFSGTAQGRYCIIYLTLTAILASAFRQSYLRRSLGSDMICVGFGMLVYELAVFLTGLGLELTYGGRLGVHIMTALISTLLTACLYKPICIMGTIGGKVWKE